MNVEIEEVLGHIHIVFRCDTFISLSLPDEWKLFMAIYTYVRFCLEKRGIIYNQIQQQEPTRMAWVFILAFVKPQNWNQIKDSLLL